MAFESKCVLEFSLVNGIGTNSEEGVGSVVSVYLGQPISNIYESSRSQINKYRYLCCHMNNPASYSMDQERNCAHNSSPDPWNSTIPLLIHGIACWVVHVTAKIPILVNLTPT